MDPITITCPGCGFSKEVPAASAPPGTTVGCPRCGERFELPRETAGAPGAYPSQPVTGDTQSGQVTVSCPHCGLSKEVREGSIPDGARLTCPRCREKFVLDERSLIPSPAPPAMNAEPSPPPPGSSADGSEPKQESSAGPSVSPVQPRRPAPGASSPGALTEIGDLFAQAWEIFKVRFTTLMILFIGTVLFMILPVALLVGIGSALSLAFPDYRTALLVVSGFFGVTAGLAASFWAFGGFICAVTDETLDIRGALVRGWRLFIPFGWLFTLLGFIINGGFLLFIIPGIIFSIWFFFAQFILADDDTRGMDALLKSREYVRGHGADIFLRFLVIWVGSAVLGAVPVIGPLLSIVALPYVMICYCLIYRDLKRIKGEVVYPCSTGEKGKWLAVGLLGYLMVPILLFALMGASISTALIMLKGALHPQERTMTLPRVERAPFPAASGSGSQLPGAGGAGQNGAEASEYMVYIYGVNYRGEVRLNGESLYLIKGERNMNYNYTGSVRLNPGDNTLQVEYEALPDAAPTELRIRLYRHDWQGGADETVNEWVFKDNGGRQSFQVKR